MRTSVNPNAVLFVGSVALNEFEPSRGAVSDVDLIAGWYAAMNYFYRYGNSTQQYPLSASKWVAKYHDGTIIEAEIAWSNSTGAELLEYAITRDRKTRKLDHWFLEDAYVASMDVQLALKLSHRYLRNSPHFLKTMRDIHLLRASGASVPPDLEQWLARREAETYNYSHPRLNVSKERFFSGDGVKYVFDHDDIHEAVKHFPRPAYTYFRVPGEEVLASRELFEASPRQTRLLAVLEESYVLAIERSLVPFPGVYAPRQAFEKALEKVCTSITSGWFREFAWENYDAVDALYDDNYYHRFEQAVGRGEVRAHRTAQQQEAA